MWEQVRLDDGLEHEGAAGEDFRQGFDSVDVNQLRRCNMQITAVTDPLPPYLVHFMNGVRAWMRITPSQGQDKANMIWPWVRTT